MSDKIALRVSGLVVVVNCPVSQIEMKYWHDGYAY